MGELQSDFRFESDLLPEDGFWSLLYFAKDSEGMYKFLQPFDEEPTCLGDLHPVIQAACLWSVLNYEDFTVQHFINPKGRALNVIMYLSAILLIKTKPEAVGGRVASTDLPPYQSQQSFILPQWRQFVHSENLCPTNLPGLRAVQAAVTAQKKALEDAAKDRVAGSGTPRTGERSPKKRRKVHCAGGRAMKTPMALDDN